MQLSSLSRSYDLRAVYPTDISEGDYKMIGQAFGSWAGEGTIYVGGDARLSTPSLKNALIEGLVQAGRKVVDLGIVSSDMLQFSTIHFPDASVGIMITASHNPKQYNGLKSCLKNAAPINLKFVGPELIHLIESNSLINNPSTGSVEYKDILTPWIDFLESHAPTDIRHLKIVADAGNGVAGIFMQALADRLGFTLIPLYFEPDGNFPNHHPSPIESKNVQDLLEKVRETGADIGVAFDGDADRAVMCDEHGNIINAAITLAAIAELFLTEKPGKKIVYNATCGHIVPDTVQSLGGIAVREKVGNVYIKEQLASDLDIVFGGEHSSHYYFRDLGNADSGVLAFLYLLCYLEQFEMKASELQEKFGKYVSIEETNFRVRNVTEVVEHLSNTFTDGTQDRLDGLTVTYPNSWFNVRGSSNEPLIRLNVESTSKEELQALTEKVISQIEPFCVK